MKLKMRLTPQIQSRTWKIIQEKSAVNFKEGGELLYGKKFSSKMKGRIHQSCVRSAMLYESENEMAILRRTEKAMIRAMCGFKLIEKRWSQKRMSLLGLKDTLDGLTKASAVRGMSMF